MPTTLSAAEVSLLNEYWFAANYLTVGQIYLKDNALLERPLAVDDIKPRLLGHWGTTAGLNFIYTHLNRLIKLNNLNMMFVIGPGHGGPGLSAHTYMEGSYSEIYPYISPDKLGMERLFRQFSWPYGVPSHVSPDIPGSIHEGGELGYSLFHAYGAAFDNPSLVVACIVGDGEAETGPLATSWHSNKFLNPRRDGVVLPILHLNGYKIANPTLLARMTAEERQKLFEGYGYTPHVVSGSDPETMHRAFAETLEICYAEIEAIQKKARVDGSTERPRWPMIIFESPKGWTGPKFVDGKPVEGTWRAHQVPLDQVRTNPEHLAQLEAWMRSYKPETLFDKTGRLRPDLSELAPKGQHRMGMNPHANGGLLLKPLDLPDFRKYALTVDPGVTEAEATRNLGNYLRDVMSKNLESENFRLFGPDETASNRLEAVYEASPKEWMEAMESVDENLSQDGRVMEILSEHACQGWLEGYLLTGRHGFFSCYEAFIHIVDSMFNQHAKWLKATHKLPWRKPIASLNYLLSSHVWRQDHNGFSHQDPGFIDHVANKRADTVRIYLPPDANTLLSVTDHCLRTKNYVNLIVAGKQPAPQFLNMDDAIRHCTVGLGTWAWASNDEGEPDVVMASAGDVPTLEALAATTILRKRFPDIRIRFVNVVDLLALQTPEAHPHGLTESEYDAIFTRDTPCIFAFHGYQRIVHELTYKRANHDCLHVHGYKEEGTTTTPFDMTVLNELDRFQLALDAIEYIPRFADEREAMRDWCDAKLQEHKLYVSEYGQDLEEVRNWKWDM